MSRSVQCLLSADYPPMSAALQGASVRRERKLNSLGAWVELWTERARQRRELRELVDAPDEVFKDVGLSRYDVRREAGKRFWCE